MKKIEISNVQLMSLLTLVQFLLAEIPVILNI